MLDDVKKYMLLRKKRTCFLNKLYKKQNLHDQDYIHLKNGIIIENIVIRLMKKMKN